MSKTVAVSKAIMGFAVLLSSQACGASGVYPVSAITIEHVSRGDGGILLRYRTKLETLYTSPGVLVTRSGQDVALQVVRCHVEAHCTVDVVSRRKEGGFEVNVSVPAGTRTVYLADASRRVALSE